MKISECREDDLLQINAKAVCGQGLVTANVHIIPVEILLLVVVERALYA